MGKNPIGAKLVDANEGDVEKSECRRRLLPKEVETDERQVFVGEGGVVLNVGDHGACGSGLRKHSGSVLPPPCEGEKGEMLSKECALH